jgi:WS/DGAT/MGAT family acyltransferase
MARYAYDRLTALDNSFLVLERSNAYMHVASTQIHDAGPLKKSGGGIDAGAIKELTAASLHLIPRYRQKLKYVPLENHPVWVDDRDFNIDYHIRHTSLPRPGSDEQLKRLSARVMQQHLDRSRPLWEMWVVEGLQRGRFALISKVHHSMVDGVSGVDLMRILMSLDPDEPLPDTPSFIPRPAPSRMGLLCDEMRRRAALPFRALGDMRRFFNEAQDVSREIRVQLRALRGTLGQTLRTPSQTPLNHAIGPHRRFDWLTMDLDDIKTIRKRLHGTVNDVVLTIVTGAVRRFLTRRQVDLSDLRFRIMAPVSIRTPDQSGSLGNQVSVWLVDLPIRERDPRKQLVQIARRTAELKESKQAVGASMLTQAAEWTPSALLALGARNVTRLLPFNMVVTNVPGPQIPIYMAGARMLEIYPHVPLVDNLGLGVALLSYDGKLCWGFNADYDLVPDLHSFVSNVRQSFDELSRLAHEAPIEVRAEPTPEPRIRHAGPPAPVVRPRGPGKRTNGPTATR